jgi:hypothetical protein
MFAEEEHAEIFREAFGAASACTPRRRAKARAGAQWRKAPNEQKSKREY